MNPNNLDTPLVTILVITYNQEAYIEAAMKAALSQTYTPLQVLVSDDGSSDETWKLIQRVADNYKGEHRITLNQNARNLGIARHVDTACRMAKGEFIVLAPGDDVSHPDRVNRLVDVWCASDPRPSLVCSNALRVDELGRELGQIVDPRLGFKHEKFEKPFTHPFRYLGATSGFESRIYHAFPPVTEDIICEDAISFHRAHLLNGVTYLPESLVDYRIHEKGASQLRVDGVRNYVSNFRRWRPEALARLRQYRKDVLHLGGARQVEYLVSIAEAEHFELQLICILEGGFGVSSAALIRKLLSWKESKAAKKEILKMFIYRWVLVFLPA